MPNITTDREKELQARVELLGQAVRQLLDQRKESVKIAAENKFWANHYTDRYHTTRRELVKARLRLRDASDMINALLEDGNQKPPDIKLGDENLV